LPDVPEVVDAPEVLDEVEPELEVEEEPEVEVCAFTGRACSASADTASAAKLKRTALMVVILTIEWKGNRHAPPPKPEGNPEGGDGNPLA
jgi:hypothetical protein